MSSIEQNIANIRSAIYGEEVRESIASSIEELNDSVHIDVKSELFSLLASKSTAIPSEADLNDYRTAGNYSIANSVTARTISNCPIAVGGKIIVMQTSNASSLVQLVIGNDTNGMYIRHYAIGEWSEWVDMFVDEDKVLTKAISSAGLVSNAQVTSLDDLKVNTICGFTSSDKSSIANFPKNLTKGGLIFTFNFASQLNGRVQVILPWNDEYFMIYMRYYQSGWKQWMASGNEGNVTTITCGPNGDYTNLVDALDYVTSDELRNTWSEENRLVIQLEAGTYSMNKIATLYSQDSTRYRWGVYIPRCCTLRGKGKEKTKITYDYTGSDDWILGHLSPINMPYESSLEDLSIIAKNCRYCVHSDGDDPFSRAWALSNNTIKVKNVRMIHEGYDDGKTPTYNVPSAWGAGIRNNVVREFVNCEFYAKHMAWFTHNTVGQTDPSEIVFDNCKFYNLNDSSAFGSGGSYDAVTFISWGTNVISNVSLKNCYANRPIGIRGSSTYSQDTTCDYFVNDDSDNFIFEYSINDSQEKDTWINKNCIVAIASVAATAYRPISVDYDGYAVAYNINSFKRGIAVCSASKNDSVTVQTKGYVSSSRLGISGFPVGTELGYSNGNWIDSSVKPLVRVITSGFVEIIQ